MANLNDLTGNFDPNAMFSAFEQGSQMAAKRRAQENQSRLSQLLGANGGDYKAGATSAFGLGELDVGLSLAKLAQQQQKSQAELDQQNRAGSALAQLLGADYAPLAEADPDLAAKMFSAKNQAERGAQTQYGLNPLWATDAQGNPVALQLSNGGGAPQRVPLPDGMTLTPGVRFLDTGTGYVPANVKTGATNPALTVPKNIAGAETQKALGESAGKQVAGAPNLLNTAGDTLKLLDKLQTHPALERATGFSSFANAIPGTAGYDFANVLQQVKSGAFLSAIPQLQGMGALSNVEGATATAAVNRMNAATSKEEFLSALADYREIVARGRNKAIRIVRQQQEAGTTYPGGDGISPQDMGGTFTPAPQIRTGQTATNQATGEKIMWDGNSWVKQ